MSDQRTSMSLDLMIGFEFGLLMVALIIGTLVGFDPLQTISRGPEHWRLHLWHMVLGAALALPLLGVFIALDSIAEKLMHSVRDVLFETLAPVMMDAGWAGRALVSLAAGIGEEILFRGLIQDGLAQLWGVIPALLVASLIFGIAHWVNTPYLGFATGVGAIFGLLFIYTGSLVAPIVMHAVYDFLALNRLVDEYQDHLRTPPARADQAADDLGNAESDGEARESE